MPRPIGVVTILGLFACGCVGSGPPPARGSGGTLTLRRDGRTVIEAPAQASHCPSDSTTALLADGADWVVALSVRAAWPPESALTLAVSATSGGPGTARLAARPTDPERGGPLVAARGTVRLEPGPDASGMIDAVAPTSPGSPDSVRLTGTFRDVPVRADVCAVAGAATP